MHELEKLNASHLHMVELCLAGNTITSIAQALDRSPQGVGLIVNSPLFQDELARRRRDRNIKHDETSSTDLAEAERILNKGSIGAATVLVEQLRNPDDKLAQSSAIAILNQTFNRQKVQASQGNLAGVVVISDKGMDLLTRALSEDRRGSSGETDNAPVDGELVQSETRTPELQEQPA